MIPRLLTVSVFLLAAASSAAAQPTVFLVRHAERADAGMAKAGATDSDPDLSAAGRTRADLLARMLRDAKITAIFTTEFKRTQQTAAPLATRAGVKPVPVSSKDLPALAQKIKTAAGNVLVVGHSNTVPEVIKALGIADPVAIGDTEFDNLFILSRGTLVRLRY